MGLGKDNERELFQFTSHIKDPYCQHDMTVDVDLDHLAEVEFVTFLQCKVTL